MSTRKLAPSRILIHALLTLGAMLMVGPFLWMVSTSLQTLGQSTQIPPIIIPPTPYFGNFRRVFETLPFATFYKNTIIITVARVVGQVFFCSLAAYAFARIEFPGRNTIFIALLTVLMVPGQAYIIPQYLLMMKLGWLDSLKALIVPGLTSVYGTFLLRQFFLSLPTELQEAAIIDGCNHFMIYWKIFLPLSKPAVTAMSIFTSLWSWNQLMWPLIVNTSQPKMPLAAGLASLQGQYSTNYPLLMAGALLAVLPMIIMFLILQNQFIEGIALTGTKA